MSLAHITPGANENHVLNHVLKHKGHAELAGPTPNWPRESLPSDQSAASAPHQSWSKGPSNPGKGSRENWLTLPLVRELPHILTWEIWSHPSSWD